MLEITTRQGRGSMLREYAGRPCRGCPPPHGNRTFKCSDTNCESCRACGTRMRMCAGRRARRWARCARTWAPTCSRRSTPPCCPASCPSWTTSTRRACRSAHWPPGPRPHVLCSQPAIHGHWRLRTATETRCTQELQLQHGSQLAGGRTVDAGALHLCRRTPALRSSTSARTATRSCCRRTWTRSSPSS